MVLKKSNSRLNSGATQRAVTHEGINKLYDVSTRYAPYVLGVENYLVLTTDVNISNPEALNSLRVCLEEMYAYLGFDMPDLSQIINGHLRCTNNALSSSPTYIAEESLDKSNKWLLPERIALMKTDIDFLRCLTRNLDVRFHEVRDSVLDTITNCLRSLRTKTIASSEIIEKSSDCAKQPSTETRRRQTCKSRGVQRSHLLKRSGKKSKEVQQSEEDEEKNEYGHLDIYLYGPFRMETRSAYHKLDKKVAGYRYASRLKSSAKMKGRSRWRSRCHLDYCNRDLEIDTRDGITEVCEDDIDSTMFIDNEEVTTNHMPQSQEMNYSITEFITDRRRHLNGEKKGKRITATAKEENCDPIVDRTRHPKGSFVLVSKDEYQWQHVNRKKTTRSFPQQANSNFAQYESQLVQKTVTDVGLDIRTTGEANTTTAFEQDVLDDFDSGFVLVNLAFSEVHEKWFSLSQEQSGTEECVDNKYPMKFGDNLPECFIVDCNPDKIHTSDQSWRVLIGRRTEPGSDLWLVSIQDQWQTPAQTKQHLQKLTADCKKASFSISELIDIATALDSREITTQPARTSEPDREVWLSTNFVWRNMPLNIFTVTESCTVEETANIFKEEFIIDRKVSKMQNENVESHDDSNSTECGVCLMDYDNSALSASPIVLLPCSHKYCVCCWRAHLQHCIRNVANRITCMSTNCTNVMDIATMSTILPYTLVHNWQAQVRNRRIDSSPYCRWCPNVACDKVAVSRSETLKEQFGKVITCACQQCWCGGCQGDPHWPASCDQMAAYRKLLAKTNSKFTFPSHDIVYKVKVKQCPKCHYPIEKNMGCPAMYCPMCNYYFCWNCLQREHTHLVCLEKNVGKTKHFLTTKLEINGALSWYPRCITLRRNMEALQKMKPWIQMLHTKIKCPLLLALPVYTSNQAVHTAALRAEECVLFLRQAYILQELVHVLTGFAELSRRCESKSFVKRARCKMFTLDFIVWRLKEAVLEKKLSHLCKVDKFTIHLLRAGRNVMRELSLLATGLQTISKDVETSPIGELDPAQLIRHR